MSAIGLFWFTPDSRNDYRRSALSQLWTQACIRIMAANNLAVRRALELAGVEFIDENGGGPGVRLRKRQRAKQTK
jgi:hypothetical protein